MREIIIRKNKKDEIVILFPYEINDEDGTCMFITKKGHNFEFYETLIKRTSSVNLSEDEEYKIMGWLFDNWGYTNLKTIKERNYEKYMKAWMNSTLNEYNI